MIVMKKIISTLAICFPIVTLSAQSATLTLLFAGDIMGHDTQIQSAYAMGNGTYNYHSDFNLIQAHISRADIAIGNLEVTFAGAPYKGYPAFSSPDALAGALKDAGFDIMVNANNHALDRGRSGLERTLEVLDSAGLVQTGVFKDQADRNIHYPLIAEKRGIRLALLNYTYGTNGIRITPPNIVNTIDTAQIRQDLQKAATAEPDFTIVLMHWGVEYQRTENSTQQELAMFLFAHGADAIIGSHPHVVQPIREYANGKLVVYSLGNMISNQRKRYTDGGILFGMTLEKRDHTRIARYDYLPVWVHKVPTDKGTDFRLVPAATDSSYWKELGITPDDGTAMQLFLEDTRKNLGGIPERAPY
jgi:poly-gamma-glutamate capsule biosynthesis protein CapA/YwtB (metallophosphatase superfamily)